MFIKDHNEGEFYVTCDRCHCTIDIDDGKEVYDTEDGNFCSDCFSVHELEDAESSYGAYDDGDENEEDENDYHNLFF